MKKRTGRGGSGRNQGLRKGTYKNALKQPSERRSAKKQVSFTPGEFKRIVEAMRASGIEIFNEFGREAILKRVESILNEKSG